MLAKPTGGFSLVELITVIVILGVLAAVVGPRFASTDVYEARTFYDDVLQAIRFAQVKANGSGCLTQISFTATGYSVQADSDCNSGNGMSPTAITSPADLTLGYSEQAPLPNGISYSASVNPLLFDGQGHARNSSLAILAAPAQVSIGGNTILIEGATGYVH